MGIMKTIPMDIAILPAIETTNTSKDKQRNTVCVGNKLGVSDARIKVAMGEALEVVGVTKKE